MAASPDDRFAGLINSSAERGGWVPGDVFSSDTEGEEEPVEPRRVRLPILVALAVATAAVIALAFFVFRPAPQHDAAGAPGGSGGVPTEQQASETHENSETGAKAGTDAKPGTADASRAPTGPAEGTVVVHVTGQVHRPSVVTLDAGARVQDAVEAAGGLKSDADAEAINLARVLGDGEQIHIPAVGEDTAAKGAGGADGSADGAADPGPAPGPAPGPGSGGAQSPGGGSGTDSGTGSGTGAKIDLNSADLTTLQSLPGVGPVTAEAIIAHREQQPFGSVDDLLLVKGIGPKTFESLKDLVTVG